MGGAWKCKRGIFDVVSRQSGWGIGGVGGGNKLALNVIAWRGGGGGIKGGGWRGGFFLLFGGGGWGLW
ncbi:unnamed protein product [Dicrocoelium dendriticum]|nr:unnamed protein product [Dicrocoelium dendriticum]